MAQVYVVSLEKMKAESHDKDGMPAWWSEVLLFWFVFLLQIIWAILKKMDIFFYVKDE